MKLVAERNRVIVEGAAACAVAAAISGRAGSGRVVAIVSGGNIDLSRVRGTYGLTPPARHDSRTFRDRRLRAASTTSKGTRPVRGVR